VKGCKARKQGRSKRKIKNEIKLESGEEERESKIKEAGKK
jgi:hypothetical protein